MITFLVFLFGLGNLLIILLSKRFYLQCQYIRDTFTDRTRKYNYSINKVDHRQYYYKIYSLKEKNCKDIK